MQPLKPSGQYCVFNELPNGIWAFEFLKATHEAVDEWVAWQNYLKNSPPREGDRVVRTLLDFRPDGLVSMMYALQKNNEWRKENQDIQNVLVKVAVVLKPMNGLQKGYADLVKEGINVFGMRTVHLELFDDDYGQAVQWLLET